MFLGGDAFSEILLYSLQKGENNIDDIVSSLSLFSKEVIVKKLVELNNRKIITLDCENDKVYISHKMKDVIKFLVESGIVNYYENGYITPFLKTLFEELRKKDINVNFDSNFACVVNKCLSSILKNDFSNEILLLDIKVKRSGIICL